MRTGLRNHILYAILLLLISPLSAQQYIVKSYGIENGLPTRNIHDACQDKSGIMWFATSYGITKYDGFSFTNFDSKNGLPEQLYRKIKVDERGILWATPDEKLDTIVFYKDKKWSKIPPPPAEARNHQINSFDILYRNNKPEICIGSYDGYYIYKNNAWKHYTISANEKQNYVYTVISKNQKFYLSTKEGVCIVDENSISWELNKLFEAYGKDIISINIENKNLPNEKIWLLSEKWLGFIQNNHFTRVTDKFQLPHPTIFYYSFVNFDKKGNVIFGNIWAKYFISKFSDVPMPLMISNGFLSDGATSVFIDREQNFWITDTRGINKINNLKVVNYYEKNGMLENEVTAIVETDDGKIILGHNTGLSILAKNQFKTIAFPDSKENTRRIQDMIKDDKGNIWFVSISLGLGRLQPGGTIKWYYSEKYPTITAVHQDKSGRIWVGADRKLLYIENDQLVEYKKYTADKNTIRRIFSSMLGGLYIVGLDGIWNIVHDSITKIPAPPDKKIDNVFSYFKAKNGEEYVGTLNGLCMIKNGRLSKYHENGIEINTPLFFILQDTESNYWLGSDQGLYKWDGKKTIETYNIYNGLAGWETNRAAGLLDSKGRVWVGTDRGLSCFEPDYDKVAIPSPDIKLLNVEDSKGVLYDLNKKSTIASSDNTLIFHFRGISYLNEQLIEYRYKLEGFDKQWQETNQAMLDKIKYIGLRPGKYVFCVMARNFSGQWSEISRSEVIKIQPPFYLTWWFILFSILAFDAFAFALFRIYVQKIHNASLTNEIIERKLIEQALIESRQKYQGLVDMLPETVFESDCKGKLLYLNDTGVRLFGYLASEIGLSLYLQQFFVPESLDEITSHINTVHDLKQPCKSTLTGIRKDGTTFPLSIHTVPILKNNICQGARGIIIDLTEQKRYEEQLHKNAEDLKTLNNSKDKFFSIIAHDLRSPFTSFLGFTEILDEEFDTLPETELQTIITSMRKSASNLYQLLENLLEWSMLHREITNFEPKNILLLPLITNCLELISISARQKEISISVDVPEKLMIKADIHMLQTIIRNLVSNAVKFTNRGGSVQIFASAKGEQFVSLTVKDTGIGICRQKQDEIFRLNANSKSRGTEGELSTGLGLILCKEFVEKHGGRIWVESEEGQGSAFTFTFMDITYNQLHL